MLKESQARLETQQAELEQINCAARGAGADILERQHDELAGAQAILTDKAAELERANQYKSEFLANMSHELRTPLNSSLILAKLLADNKDGNLTAEQVKFAQTISSAGNDLLALINDILDLSKIEAGKVEIAPEPVALAGVVEALVKTFEPLARAEGPPASTRHVEPGTARARSRPTRSGSARSSRTCCPTRSSSPSAARSRCGSTRRDRGRVAFAVRDTGIGIPAHAAGGHLRGVPPGRRQHAPQVRRHRPRPVDLARPRAPARRRHHACRARRARAAPSR